MNLKRRWTNRILFESIHHELNCVGPFPWIDIEACSMAYVLALFIFGIGNLFGLAIPMMSKVLAQGVLIGGNSHVDSVMLVSGEISVLLDGVFFLFVDLCEGLEVFVCLKVVLVIFAEVFYYGGVGDSVGSTLN
jgi:hypothetical protein